MHLFLQALKTCFCAHFFFKKLSFEDRLRFFHETNSKWPQIQCTMDCMRLASVTGVEVAIGSAAAISKVTVP